MEQRSAQFEQDADADAAARKRAQGMGAIFYGTLTEAEQQAIRTARSPPGSG
jgi:hypothetical protein